MSIYAMEKYVFILLTLPSIIVVKTIIRVSVNWKERVIADISLDLKHEDNQDEGRTIDVRKKKHY